MKNTVKIVGLVFLALTGLAAAVFLGQGAKTYFARANECPAQDITISQVSTNSVVVAWKSTSETQGKVMYGTKKDSLNFTAPESTTSRDHTVPVTLLTPGTDYYYLVSIGTTTCEPPGKYCKDNCSPGTFKTTSIQITPPVQLPVSSPSASIIPSIEFTQPPEIIPTSEPTSTLSTFCQEVQTNIGETNKNTAKWPTLKKYDLVADNIINSQDMRQCIKMGK